MADDKTSLLGGGQQSTSSDSDALYHDSSQSPTMRRIQIGFVGLIVIMVLISVSLSIYQGIDQGKEGALYFLLGLSLMGLVIVEICLIMFIRKGDLPKGKQWFLYFVGFCIFLEAIFTDVLVFQ
ncbi:uncharacterized protein LOC121380180 isoform X1 [Gigantopelta aegis]|uniref:uncharacterized protein LOC121380180 isoform X1 n=1 Tax=Gigantopelta aegis TaxID=1735272 RepID=UPI001B88C266|nr:uncharacterized protein LOC121380180 isoform X1 [Gigantopelta aegis]